MCVNVTCLQRTLSESVFAVRKPYTPCVYRVCIHYVIHVVCVYGILTYVI